MDMMSGSLYYHGADAVILVYDITDRKTFDNIERWRDKFEDRPDHDDGTVKVLVGCKADLGEDNQREVSIASRRPFVKYL